MSVSLIFEPVIWTQITPTMIIHPPLGSKLSRLPLPLKTVQFPSCFVYLIFLTLRSKKKLKYKDLYVNSSLMT